MQTLLLTVYVGVFLLSNHHCVTLKHLTDTLQDPTISNSLRSEIVFERFVRPCSWVCLVSGKRSRKMKSMVAKNPLTGLKLKLALWAKKLGLEHQTNCQLGGSGSKGFGYPIAKKLILDTVKRKLGLDRCKFAFTGAAPITTETLSYFGALGIQINEVYVVSLTLTPTPTPTLQHQHQHQQTDTE